MKPDIDIGVITRRLETWRAECTGTLLRRERELKEALTEIEGMRHDLDTLMHVLGGGATVNEKEDQK